MRGAIFLLLIAGGLLVAPFIFLRRPWALRIWRQFKVAVVLWVVLVIVFAIYNLVFRWEDFYG